MTADRQPDTQKILPVGRTKEQAKKAYDRMSRFYDFLAGTFERKFAVRALHKLSVKEGETILETGFGTGYCLKLIAEAVSETGKAYGIDISPGMLEVAEKRLKKAGLTGRTELYCGDGAGMPYDDNTFDGVFMSFTLELFDTPEIPVVLDEIKRVLKPGGRFAAAAMSRESGDTFMIRVYEWMHMMWPVYTDCRPIFLERSLKTAGYRIVTVESGNLFGLPVEIVSATVPVQEQPSVI